MRSEHERPGPLTLAALALLLASCDSGGAATCATCVEEKCADLVATCAADPACLCMVDCLGEAGIPGVEGCVGACGLSERPLAFVPVEACVATACPDTGDECSTPDGYVPPEVVICEEAPVEDIGGGALADCGFDADLPYEAEGAVLQLESEDGAVCVRVERRSEGKGALANTEWTVLDVHVGPYGAVAHVDDPGDICYYSSHHNFKDWVHVWTGSTRHGLKITEEGHGGARGYTLYSFEAGPLASQICAPEAEGTGPIGCPITLVPVAP